MIMGAQSDASWGGQSVRSVRSLGGAWSDAFGGALSAGTVHFI